MDCLDVNISYEIADDILTITATNASSPDMRDVEIISFVSQFEVQETGNGSTQIGIRGTCPGTGIPLKRVFAVNWDWADVEGTFTTSANVKCCPDLLTCYDYMVGISQQPDCDCISYPPDAHISHSGFYLSTLVNFKPFAFAADCDGEVWQMAEQARAEAIAEIEAGLAGCMTAGGLTEAFTFSEDIGQKNENGKAPIKVNADFLSIKLKSNTKKAGSSINIGYIYFLPFYKFDGTNYVKSDVTTSLYIYRNGTLEYSLDDVIVQASALYNRINLQELINLKLDSCDTWEFVISLWGQDYLGNGNYTAPYRIYPADNQNYKRCCGAVPPQWSKHITQTASYGNNIADRTAWNTALLSTGNYMGGVWFAVEGSCNFRDFLCQKLGGKGNMLYRLYASTLQKAWAAKFLDTVMHTDRVFEPCIRLSKEEIVAAIVAYNTAVRNNIGGIDDKGVYQQGELCRALMNTPMQGTCYVCAANSIKLGRKI